MTKNKQKTRGLWLALALIIALVAVAMLPTIQASANIVEEKADVVVDKIGPKHSHRFVVQLESPALSEVEWFNRSGDRTQALKSPDAQAYIAELQREQAAFVNNMTAAFPDARVATYVNESGVSIEATYQVVLNAVAVDMGTENLDDMRQKLAQLPGVKTVFPDYAYEPTTYTSTYLINAPQIWSQLDGQENAGAGVKVASMDGGAHHEAAMFNGTGWSYPEGWPQNGIGDAANNNGKIIASRAYFRDWDPPSVGDENTWPGTQGTSHGVHTASTAVGNVVVADYLGITMTLSGVAPGAWVMSYRVFYNSVTNNGSFYTVEGLAALEDLTMDGADVVNNSWGGGPSSAGGEFDPLDMALINASKAGVFVSMSAGNSGPGNGTTDHPSGDYINVAASTTGGTFASGRLNVSAPTPVSPTLQNMSYAGASFGPDLPIGQLIHYDYVTAMSVDPANFEGCNAWPADTFTGKAAVISRGACEFGVKVVNAENAGADFVVIYNSPAGGDGLINMGPGAVGDQATIPSIFVGHTNGTNMVAWYGQHGQDSELEINTLAFQSGNTPDLIASFSSRGPGVGNVLKPDIAAPGVNIMAQGYAPGTTGEARHLGYGQASGTSMASPHVAGAAALLRQMYPDWSNAYIKSALMSTSKYMDVYNYDGTPAQPLDMGAGRLDLTHADDPGVILDPPSLSFGNVGYMETVAIQVKVTNVSTAAETYDLSTLYTGAGFAITQTTTLTGFVVSPATITVAPGASEWFTVTFDAAMSMGVGDNQGYIIMEGDNGHHAHLPAWARVEAPMGAADVLIIDNDASSSLGMPNYRAYYTQALDNMGLTYDVWNADAYFNNPRTIPNAATLAAYKAIIYYTGDNFYPNGFFTVATALTALDMNTLTEYANNGGTLIGMGQDLAAVLASDSRGGGSFFYGFVLGGNWLQDSVTANGPVREPIRSFVGVPEAFDGISLDLSGSSSASVHLVGANEVPPVATVNDGWANFTYDMANNTLYYDATINPNMPMTITAAHIHTGTVGSNGPVAFSILTTATPITEPYGFDGGFVLTDAQQAVLLNGGYYLNIHTETVPSGELRGQVSVAVVGDGAGNQYYIDELAAPSESDMAEGFMALLQYPGPYNEDIGVVTMAHRAQPSLENPGITYYGRSIYTSFGLEGVNNGLGYTSREELLGLFLDWAMDEPTVSITDITSQYSDTGQQNIFEADVTSNITGTVGVSYRWDFGDGSDYAGPYDTNIIGYTYDVCGEYRVRVEATDSWGNVAIGWYDVMATQACAYEVFLPMVTSD